VIWVVLDLLVGLLLGFAAGAAYGALHSLRVGMYIDELVFWWIGVLDKYHPKTRRARNKISRTKRAKKKITEAVEKALRR